MRHRSRRITNSSATSAARKALLRGLVTSVIENERIITTVPKAKAVRPLVDKMITLAKARHAAHAPSGRCLSANARVGQKAVR